MNIGISIADLSGNDMFDTTNANAYDLDSIRIYRKNPDSGEIQLVNKGYNFNFYVTPYRVSVQLAENIGIPRTTTYIHWTPEDIDTVDATFKEYYDAYVVEEVFINGKQVAEKRSKRSSDHVYVHLVKDR